MENAAPEHVQAILHGEMRAGLERAGVARKVIAWLLPPRSPRKLGLSWLANTAARLDEVREACTSGAYNRPARQRDYHTAALTVLSLCAPLLRPMLQDRSLRAALAILSRYSAYLPTGDRTLLLDCLRMAGHRGDAYAAARAAWLADLDARLQLGGILVDLVSRCSSSSDTAKDTPMRLDSLYADQPAGAFGVALRTARLTAGHSQARMAAQTGIPRAQISEWERSVSVPRRCKEHLVERLDAFLRADGTLRDAYDHERAYLDAKIDRKSWRDARYADYLGPQIPNIISSIHTWIETQEVGRRRGKSHVGGALAPRTKVLYAHWIRRDFAMAAFRSDHPDERLRGLGWCPESLGVLDLGHLDLRRTVRQLTLIRAGRDTLGAADRNWANRLALLFAPDSGYVWRNAASIAASEPDAVNRCPTHFPAGAGIRPGARCETAVDRVYAQCYSANAYLVRMAKEANNCSLSPRYHDPLCALFRLFPLPLNALACVLTRMQVPERPPQNLRECHMQLAAAVIAVLLYYPYRSKDLARFDENSLVLAADGSVHYCLPPPSKNARAYKAKDPVAGILPQWLGRYVAPWLRWGRPSLLGGRKPTHFLASSHGRKVSAHYVNNLFHNYISDIFVGIFPEAPRTHYFRHIVTTDACIRHGRQNGLEIASKHVRDSGQTLVANYIIRLDIPEYINISWIPSHDESIRQAFLAVTGLESCAGLELSEIRNRAWTIFRELYRRVYGQDFVGSG